MNGIHCKGRECSEDIECVCDCGGCSEAVESELEDEEELNGDDNENE